MTLDATLRCAAVAAAVALVAAPYRAVIQSAVATVCAVAWNAIQARRSVLARLSAAGLIVAAAWGVVPLPRFHGFVPRVEVETPSDAMQKTVAPIAEVMAKANMADRMLWAAVWSKAAIVVAGDAITTEVVFTDTKSLRGFTVLALDIAWRRLGNNQPGKYAGLREATETAFADVIGKAEVPVTKELRERYAELCNAIAWAGVNGG